MKSRGAVGRKIVRVLQDRATTNYGDPVFNVLGFVLDNGDVISLNVVQLEGDYAIEGSVVRPTRFLCSEDPEGTAPWSIWDFEEANAEDEALPEMRSALLALRVGESVRFGGGAAAEIEVRRVR